MEQYWFVYSDDDGSELNPKLEPDSEQESEAESESELEPLDIHICNNQILDSKDYIDTYMINRNHIREQSKSVIPACGFLLTGAFGLLYFIFSGNSNRITIHSLIIIFILLAAITLAASIVSSIKSVQAASPLGEIAETRDQQWDILKDIYDKEHKWGKRSIQLLEIALILFVIIILYFSIAYLLGTPPANNVQMTQIPNIIFIPLPRLF